MLNIRNRVSRLRVLFPPQPLDRVELGVIFSSGHALFGLTGKEDYADFVSLGIVAAVMAVAIGPPTRVATMVVSIFSELKCLKAR